MLLWLCAMQAGHADDQTLILSSGSEIGMHMLGEGNDRMLWIPSEFGLHAERELTLARGLSARGLEIWIADLHGSYFIPPGRNSLTAIPIDEITELVRRAQPENGRLYLLSSGRGAALSLMAAREVQLSDPQSKPLGGLILFHPNLHTRPPQPGHEAEYLAVARLSNQPVYLIQPGNSAKRWHLQELVEQLEQGGSDVFTQIIPQVSDGFHLRADFTAYEAKVSAALPKTLYRAIQLLNRVNGKSRRAEASAPAQAEWSGNAFKETLQPYPGEPLAPPLALHDLQQRDYTLERYRGKVVLLNFWTTWCPPCVREIPSLGRLQEQLSQDEFVVLSVDIGESPEEVAAFLKKVPARFPVLLDPHGSTVRDWNIRAFPTSFLLDRQGIIRYAYFGALEWDDEIVMKIIRGLL